ncbi:type II toxin-antitoxin system VapC family toxin [Oscillatoria sp. HE19RPO]|jgi:predicted nucleic acid-binding protein|uniref:type II toxin-antitoxin system VapC family toxin n=1 Tax=Oscillatoria sp. HE19RPO TaxID=2954806 RepID=UPI0020C285AC|nr:PIN domain-containing protein [Oscillatoria sp. HE19RPO]
MKRVFGDTFYWIALLNPRDNWHQVALNYAHNYPEVPIITTDGVIDEILAYAASKGSLMRQKGLALCLQMRREPSIEVIAYTPEIRELGLSLYGQRLDKGYSLTDCISMIVMKQRGITEVLTHDQHFAQEGFTRIFTDLK